MKNGMLWLMTKFTNHVSLQRNWNDLIEHSQTGIRNLYKIFGMNEFLPLYLLLFHLFQQ